MAGSDVGVLCADGGDVSKVQDELVNVISIHRADYAFAALRSDGTVRAWGSKFRMMTHIQLVLCMACKAMAELDAGV